MLRLEPINLNQLIHGVRSALVGASRAPWMGHEREGRMPLRTEKHFGPHRHVYLLFDGLKSPALAPKTVDLFDSVQSLTRLFSFQKSSLPFFSGA